MLFPPGLDARRPPTRASKREVDRAMATIAEQAARLPDRYVRALGPALAEAREELRRDLATWLEKIEDGSLRFTAQRYRVALAQIEGALKALGGRLPAEVEGTLRAQGEASGAMAIEHLLEETAVFGAVFGHSVKPIQLNQAAIIAEGSTTLIPRYRNSAARYGRHVTADIRRQLAIGVARGETFEELTNRLVRLGGPRGMVSLRGMLGAPGSKAEFISEGLFRRYRHWAERIVRTEGLHAYNVHHLESLREADRQDPGYQKRWDATADARVCVLCAALDGTILDIDGVFATDANGRDVEHPPRHPNDRCVLTPWRPEWAKAPAEPEPLPTSEPATTEVDRTTEALGDALKAQGDAIARWKRETEEAERATRGEPNIDKLRAAGRRYLHLLHNTPGYVASARKPIAEAAEAARQARHALTAEQRAGRVIDRLATGDFTGAALEIQANLTLELGDPNRPVNAVVGRRMPDGVGASIGWDGTIYAPRKTLEKLRGAAVRMKANPGQLAADSELAGQPKPDDAREWLAAHQRLRDAQHLSTLTHEVAHTFGPYEPGADQMAYRGFGVVAEEMSTEASAHLHLAGYGWKVERFEGRFNHGYQHFFEETRGALAKLYGLNDSEAWAMIREAAQEFKRHPVPIRRDVASSGDAERLWISKFPATAGRDKELRAAMRAALKRQ